MGAEEARGRFLLELMRRHASVDSSILEIGCRSCANLLTLQEAGYRKLFGVEPEEGRVRRFIEENPEKADEIEIRAGPLVESLRSFEDGCADVVFTVGFFFDKEGDFRWLHPELVRITGDRLISIEDEHGAGEVVPLDHAEIYRGLGMKEIEAVDLRKIESLDSVFTARVFSKGRKA